MKAAVTEHLKCIPCTVAYGKDSRIRTDFLVSIYDQSLLLWNDIGYLTVEQKFTA